MNSTTMTSERTLAVFAHELREPLSSILLAAQAMSETGADTGVCREMGGLITRQSRYLARLIDGVLETRLRNDHTILLHKEWFDLTQVIEQTRETVRPILRERRHRLDVSSPARPVYLCADPLRIQQVLVNLLNNAAKYTEPGGSIELAVEGTNERVAITVRDNGVGMPAALLPRVFDWYEQAALRRPDAPYSGLGVGLALVKSLVESHGGDVRAYSDGPGTGSAFTVCLPIFLPDGSGRSNLVQKSRRRPSSAHPAMTTPMLDA